MELILRVEKLGSGQFMDADSGKDITVTGKVLSLHFQDGAVQEAINKAQKYDELPEVEIMDSNKKEASDLMMPNFCPYCGSEDLREPHPLDDPYCDGCGANIKRVLRQEYYLNADVSLTQEMIQDGISEGFQDYAGGSNARTTIKDS